MNHYYLENLNKETFKIGEKSVTIENPNVYFPEINTEDKTEELEFFLISNLKNYRQAFIELAEASNHVEDRIKNLQDLSEQKEIIQLYLVRNKATVIAEQTGISHTTIRKLKKDPTYLNRTNFGHFETLLEFAYKSVTKP
ncbi:hypothetical protein [Enterococcus sp. AZ103]|uniref:hypothetical protein n=1 Tax=Enterococcus sp. AZ103 TaxID=2774628 RepID=UPI003F237495